MPWSIDSAPITRGIVDIPSHGAWTADVSIDSTEAPVGPVTMSLGATSWAGYVASARVDGAGTVRLRVVGGAGGLRTVVGWRWSRAAAYTSTDLLTEIVSAGGEILGESPAALPIPRYQRQPGTVGAALDELTEILGWTWRIGASGAVDVYDPSLVAVDPINIGTLTETAATHAMWAVEDVPDLLPAVSWAHASVAVTRDSATLTLRRDSPRDVLAALGDSSRAVGRLYEGTITEQDGNRVTVDAEGWTVSDVPLILGIPGITVEVEAGTPCVLAYYAADPRRPVAFLSGWDTSPSSVRIDADSVRLAGGNKTVIRDGDVVSIPGLGVVAISIVAPDTPATPSFIRSKVKA